MTAYASVGTFLVPATSTAGTTIAVSGLDLNGQTPSFIKFFHSRSSSATDAYGASDYMMGIGWAFSSTLRCSISAFIADDQGTTQTRAITSLVAVVQETEDAFAASGLLDIDSFDTDGFTVIIDDQFDEDLRVCYLAVHCTGTFSSDIITWNPAGSAGNFDITSLSFEPDFGEFIGNGLATAVPQSRTDAQLDIGMATAAAEQGSIVTGDNDGANTVDNLSYHRSDECSGAMTSNINQTTLRTAFVAWLSNGFTLNQLDFSGTRVKIAVVMACDEADFTVFDFLTGTGTGDLTAVSLPSDPSAIFVMSACEAEHAADTPTVQLQLSFGAAVSPTERVAVASSSEDGLGTSETSSGIEHDAIGIDPDLADGIDGLLDVAEFGTNEWTPTVDDAFPVSTLFTGFAVGPAPGPPVVDNPIPRFQRQRRGATALLRM